MRLKQTSQEGFTIVELIVALVVGSVLIGSVNLIYTNQSYLSQRVRDSVLANAYAEGKIEALRSAGYLGISNGTTDVSGELPSELNAPRSASLQISTPSAGLKQVDLTLTYSEQGTPRTLSYRTYIGELGVGQY